MTKQKSINIVATFETKKQIVAIYDSRKKCNVIGLSSSTINIGCFISLTRDFISVSFHQGSQFNAAQQTKPSLLNYCIKIEPFHTSSNYYIKIEIRMK
jgi:hypothetical protein